MYKRAYVKVDLDRIRKNMKTIRSVLPEGTRIIGVVKADGYGHGAVQTAKAIEEDAAGYAVATAEEALELRGNGIKSRCWYWDRCRSASMGAWWSRRSGRQCSILRGQNGFRKRRCPWG